MSTNRKTLLTGESWWAWGVVCFISVCWIVVAAGLYLAFPSDALGASWVLAFFVAWISAGVSKSLYKRIAP